MPKRLPRRFLHALVVALVAQAASAQAPLGPQFQVNSYTTGYQRRPAVAMDADGDFIVVWQSTGSDNGDTSSFSVQGQRFDAGGIALGSQFLVNTYITLDQRHPAVAMDAGGDFVVVWQSHGSDGGDTSLTSVQGRRFAADGSAVGSQFQVNSYTTNDQFGPAIAMTADGHFVVVWSSYGSDDGDTSYASIQGQRFAADGGPLGFQFQVNSYISSYQRYPAVAMNADGGFVVVWESDGSDNGDTSGESVQGQRFDADGFALGSQFLVNSFTPYSQFAAAVTMSAAGDFVIVWLSSFSANGDADRSIQGQRFEAGGSALGSQFLVNSYTTSLQSLPDVAETPGGGFVVVWITDDADNGDTYRSIQGQRFDADGDALGTQFLVNSYTTSYQENPAIAMDSFGGFVVVWDSYGSGSGDTSSYSIQGQRFPALLFADGFESGSLSAWSASVP